MDRAFERVEFRCSPRQRLEASSQAIERLRENVETGKDEYITGAVGEEIGEG